MSELKFDNDIAGEFPIQRETVKIGKNLNLKRGTILVEHAESDGAKAKYSFALSAYTAAADKTVTLKIGAAEYVANIGASDTTVAAVLGKIATAAAADTKFDVTADTANGKLVIEAKKVGADSTAITLETTATLTIGAKSEDVAGADAVEGGFFPIAYDSEEPVGYLLKDIETAADEAGYADMARTGCFAKDAAIIDENVNAKTVKDKLAARCLFFKAVSAVKD